MGADEGGARTTTVGAEAVACGYTLCSEALMDSRLAVLARAAPSDCAEDWLSTRYTTVTPEDSRLLAAAVAVAVAAATRRRRRRVGVTLMTVTVLPPGRTLAMAAMKVVLGRVGWQRWRRW